MAKKRVLLCGSFFVVVSLVALVALGISIYFLVVELNPEETEVLVTATNFTSLPKQLFANIQPAGFDSMKVNSINVSSAYLPNETSVDFFFGECEVIHRIERKLPSVSRKFNESASNQRKSFNYDATNEDGMYTANGTNSFLIYNISASSTSSVTEEPCSVEVFLFNFTKPYKIFIGEDPDTPARGFVDKWCVPVGIGNNHSATKTNIVLSLKSPDVYFVAIHIKEGINIEANISGQVFQLSSEHFSYYKGCDFTIKERYCMIPFNSPRPTIICILARASDYVTVNISEVRIDSHSSNRFSLIGVIGTPLVIITLIMATACVIIVYRKRQQKTSDSEQEPLVPRQLGDGNFGIAEPVNTPSPSNTSRTEGSSYPYDEAKIQQDEMHNKGSSSVAL